jgi:AcrR family transcriptional regulator
MAANPEMHGAAAPARETGKEAARGRRVAGQDPAKRQQIIDGAKRCFLNLGFEAASMNDIAAEAGVSKGTLYVYFADKEDLFAELCDAERKRHLQFAQERLLQSKDIEEGLFNFGVALTTRLTSTEVIRAMRMVLGVAERMPRLARRFFGPEPFSGVSVIQAYLDQNVAAGKLEIADTEFAARQFVDLAMSPFFKRRLFGSLPDELSREEIEHAARAAVRMFLDHYRARAKT